MEEVLAGRPDVPEAGEKSVARQVRDQTAAGRLSELEKSAIFYCRRLKEDCLRDK